MRWTFACAATAAALFAASALHTPARSEAPGEVSGDQLKELNIRLRQKAKAEEAGE